MANGLEMPEITFVAMVENLLGFHYMKGQLPNGCLSPWEDWSISKMEPQS